MYKKVKIGDVFEAVNGSFAKVVTFTSKGRAIVRTYHPRAANDFLYDKEVCLGNLVSGRFSSADTPNKFGCYMGYGVYNTSNKRAYNAHNNTQKYAFQNGRLLRDDWLDFQNFAAWFVSHPYHLSNDWLMNYDLLLGGNCVLCPDSTCLLPRKIVKAIRVKKTNRIAIKLKKGYRIGDDVNLGLTCNIIFTSEDAAISMYCRLKEDKVKQLAEQYKPQLPEHVYQALKVWKCCVDMS